MSVVTIAEAWPAAGRPFTVAELDGRLGYDAQVLGTGTAQDAVQPTCDDLVNCCRPGAHDERSVQ